MKLFYKLSQEVRTKRHKNLIMLTQLAGAIAALALYPTAAKDKIYVRETNACEHR